MLDALLFTKTPSLLKSIYPACVWQMSSAQKKLYLTFDDGPISDVTPFVLDELKKWDAKASFFCIGKNVDQHPELFQRIINEGHSVGNHTYNHLNGWNTRDYEYFTNVEKCNEVLLRFNLQNTNLFRPPYGKLKPSQYTVLKTMYSIVMWDVLSFDFDLKASPEGVLKNILQYSEPGSIIVMHDSLKAESKVKHALPMLLEHFTKLDYTFEKL